MESALRRSAPPDLKLIETFCWEPGAGFVRLPGHLARLAEGAERLGIALEPSAVERALAGVAGGGTLRVRLALALDGEVAATVAPLGAAKAEWAVVLAGERVSSRDPWRCVKSTRREAYDAARAALPAGIDEAVFLNERGEVAEGAITNVFLDMGAGLVTPPRGAGLLPGVLRAELLAGGVCREAVLRPEELRRGRLYVGNSLRGLVPARLVEG